MDIKIFDLRLKNFKGIKDLEIIFNGQDTNIYGKNATGKTTIFDAFKWLFFDKDSNDKKDFNIKTLDENNKPIHYLEHQVEATLIVDGQDITFKKVFQEKWVKRRGQEQQKLAGHETNYWIDEVPIKKKDYEEKINSIIPESLFKLITDPLFFNNQMSWKERRELLMNISGTTITDEDILNSNEQFALLKENLQGREIEDYKKVVSARIKVLNNEKEKIPIRIDELTNTLITDHNVNYEELEVEKLQYSEELQNIEKEMTDIQTRVRENMKKADQLAIAKNELHNLKFRLEVEHDDKYSKKGLKLNNEKSFLEGCLRNSNKQLEELTFSIEKDKNKKEDLYTQWDEVNKTKLEHDPNSFICPACKREYETNKVEEMKKLFEANFNEHKEHRKEEINKEGQAINKRIQENTETVNRLKEEIEAVTIKLTEVNLNIEKMQKEKEEVGPFDVTTVPEYQEKLKQLENLQKVVDNLDKEDTTELQNRKSNVVEKINNIDKQLNEKLVQEKTKARIAELDKEEESIAKKIQELESQEYQIEQFTKAKVELLESTINSNFNVVKFRLTNIQTNGGLVECCDTLVNGVPYQDVNNAHKIIAGLDIIQTLSRFYNTQAPIFIDNRESINNLSKINAQLISLIVTEDTALRIEVMM